jgi:hypothetical protein
MTGINIAWIEYFQKEKRDGLSSINHCVTIKHA